MKRALLIGVALLLLQLCAAANALGAEVRLLVWDSFDGCATNQRPDGAAIKGAPELRVLEDGIQNKAVYIPVTDGQSELAYPVSQKANPVIFSADIKSRTGNAAVRLLFYDHAGKKFAPVTIGACGEISSHENQPLGGIGKNTYTNLAVKYDNISQAYSVYVDGRSKIGGVASGAALGDITKCAVEVTGGGQEDEIYIDNLAIYQGEGLLREFPRQPYLKQEVEFIPPKEAEETVGEAIYLNANFEDEAETGKTIGFYRKTNKIDLVMDEGKQSRVAHLDKVNDDDVYLETSVMVPKRYVVLQSDIRIDKTGQYIALFNTKDKSNRYNVMAQISGGSLVLSDGTAVCKMTRGKWYNVAFCVDYEAMTYDVYLDGQQVKNRVPLPNKEFETLSVIRMQVAYGGAAADFWIDNFRVYEGKSPRDIPEEAEVTGSLVFPSDNDVLAALEGTAAFHKSGGSIFYHGKKHPLPVRPFEVEGTLYLPVRSLAEAFGMEAVWEDKTNTALLDGRIAVRVGKKAVQVSGADVILKNPAIMKENSVCVPVEEFTQKVLKKQVFREETGAVVLSEQAFAAAEQAMVKKISDYLFYTRPDPAQIQADFTARWGDGQDVHPRILADKADFERIRQEVQTDAYKKKWFELLLEDTQKIWEEAPLKYEKSDGIRLLPISRAMLGRAEKFGMLYQLTGETRYVERAWKDIEAVCAFPNWNPSHYLDVGEMTAALGMCYDWMYDALTKDQRETIEKAIIEKGLTPTKKAYYGLLGQNGNFVNVDNNWNVVCNGGAVLAALAITSADPALCFDLVANAARSLEYMMCHFAPDGAWYEGAMYWGYTMSYMAKFLGSMDSVLGTDYGISNYPGFSHTGDFNLQINGMTSVNNFHDSATGLTNNAEVFWLADKMDRPDLAQARMATMKLHGFSGSLYDILWYDVNTSQEEIRLPLDDYFGDADVVTMRENWNSKEAMYASYHAGATSVNHGQLDNGTFVLDFLGERWATDFGGDDYNLPGYFGDQRYQYYRNRAEGHNIYVIDPDAGPELDLKSVTTVESLVSKPRGAISVANLAPGYGGKVSAAKRGYMLTDDRRTFVVRDEINLKQESGVYWFLHTQAQIDIRDDQTIFLTQNGKKLQLQLNVDAADYSVYVMDALPLPVSPQSDKQNKNGGFHKIVIQFRDSGPVSITAKLCAANEYQAGQVLEDVPIDKWKIPDGDIKPLPMLDGITADGKPLDGFAPDKSAYSIKLAPGYAGLPQIETQAQGKRIEIQRASTPQELNVIRVFDPEDDKRFRVYTVGMVELPVLPPVEGRKRYSPFDVKASANPELDNIDANASDGDLATRWSAEGEQTLTLDLGEAKQIGGFAVACMNGAARKYYFAVEVSEDGDTFETVYSGETSGTTDGYEIFRTGRQVSARYVRYRGKGNSVNSWNSITEFAVLE